MSRLLDPAKFYNGDRFKGPRRKRRRAKFNHQSNKRRIDLYYARVNAALGGDFDVRNIPAELILN